MIFQPVSYIQSSPGSERAIFQPLTSERAASQSSLLSPKTPISSHHCVIKPAKNYTAISPPDIIGGRSPTFTPEYAFSGVIGGKSHTFTPEYPFSDTIGGRLPIFAPESLIFNFIQSLS